MHTAFGVAIGGFLLAVAATVHAITVGSNTPLGRYLVALVAWPIFTAVPAFLVALAASWALAHMPVKRVAQ
jgi:hypothetical protein